MKRWQFVTCLVAIAAAIIFNLTVTEPMKERIKREMADDAARGRMQ